MARDGKGWYRESHRHSLAAKGIKTGRKALGPKYNKIKMSYVRSEKRPRQGDGKQSLFHIFKYKGRTIEIEDNRNVSEAEIGRLLEFLDKAPEPLTKHLKRIIVEDRVEDDHTDKYLGGITEVNGLVYISANPFSEKEAAHEFAHAWMHHLTGTFEPEKSDHPMAKEFVKAFEDDGNKFFTPYAKDWYTSTKNTQEHFADLVAKVVTTDDKDMEKRFPNQVRWYRRWITK